jgi:hypothetical protein
MGFKNLIITIWISFIFLKTGTRRFCGDSNKLYGGQLFASCKTSQEGVCSAFNNPIHTNSTKKSTHTNQTTRLADRGKAVSVSLPPSPHKENATPINQWIKRINLKYQQVTEENYMCGTIQINNGHTSYP